MMKELKEINLDRILDKIEQEKSKYILGKISLHIFIFELEECISRLRNEQLAFEMEG